MKELDLLKKHWNQQKDFPKLSAEEITKMIHKKSSSIVKWILFISIIEFLLLNILGYFSWKQEDYSQIESKTVLWILSNIDLISGIISLVFIGVFYSNYRKISTSCSTTELMKQIIKTKKTVNYYIYITIVLTCVFFLIIMQQTLGSKAYTDSRYLIGIGVTLLTLAIFVAFIWLYYRLIYGLLIKKLMKNYKELQKVDL